MANRQCRVTANTEHQFRLIGEAATPLPSATDQAATETPTAVSRGSSCWIADRFAEGNVLVYSLGPVPKMTVGGGPVR